MFHSAEMAAVYFWGARPSRNRVAGEETFFHISQLPEGRFLGRFKGGRLPVNPVVIGPPPVKELSEAVGKCLRDTFQNLDAVRRFLSYY